MLYAQTIFSKNSIFRKQQMLIAWQVKRSLTNNAKTNHLVSRRASATVLENRSDIIVLRRVSSTWRDDDGTLHAKNPHNSNTQLHFRTQHWRSFVASNERFAGREHGESEERQRRKKRAQEEEERAAAGELRLEQFWGQDF